MDPISGLFSLLDYHGKANERKAKTTNTNLNSLKKIDELRQLGYSDQSIGAAIHGDFTQAMGLSVTRPRLADQDARYNQNGKQIQNTKKGKKFDYFA